MDEFFRIARKNSSEELKQTIALRTAQAMTLKLFQPIHQRYYLVCASLCCRMPGFPDRQVRIAEEERVFFLLRKKVKSGNASTEYAWVVDNDKKGAWKPVPIGNGGPVSNVEGKEETLAMFPFTAGNDRTLFVGYVPVTSRATYQPQPGSTLLPSVSVDPQDRFDENITVTLQALLTSNGLDLARAREISLFLLYDLDTFLQQYLPTVVSVIKGQNALLNSEEQALVTYLQAQKPSSQSSESLASLLRQVNAIRNNIAAMDGGSTLPIVCNLRDFNSGVDWTGDLRRSVIAAIGKFDKKSPPVPKKLLDAEPQPPVEVPKLLARTDEVFTLRCVYERPQCSPSEFYVSQPTEEFVLASAMDPDGPARQIRLELPRDVSIANLRKFKKNVGFVMSDAMRNKMARITGYEKALLKDEGLGPEGSFELGFICTFSFQIIFIVAFFLLQLFVLVLNSVFWWMAFFRICLPIPVKAKE